METIYPTKDAKRYKAYKHSDSTDDLKVNWREYLDDGEAISSQTITANNITVDSNSSSGQESTIWLSGGEPKTNAYIDLTITTDNATARIFEVRIYFYFEPQTEYYDSGYYY